MLITDTRVDTCSSTLTCSDQNIFECAMLFFTSGLKYSPSLGWLQHPLPHTCSFLLPGLCILSVSGYTSFPPSHSLNSAGSCVPADLVMYPNIFSLHPLHFSFVEFCSLIICKHLFHVCSFPPLDSIKLGVGKVGWLVWFLTYRTGILLKIQRAHGANSVGCCD